MTLGAMGLSKLPPSLLGPAMLALLSADGQVYAACHSCGWEHRVDVLGKTSPKKIRKALAKQQCAGCDRTATLEPVRHALLLTVICRDCATRSRVDIGADALASCPACRSARIEPVAEELTPAYPVEFSELEPSAWRLTSGDRHVWGRSGTADGQMIYEMAQMVKILPEPHRYYYLMILFAHRLRITSPYDPEGMYTIVNIAANLEQDYLRAVGDPVFGVWALEDFEEMIRLAPDELNRAVAEHSFAMGAFSMISRWQEAYVDAVSGRQGLRGFAVGAAIHSEQVLEGYTEQGGDRLKAQLARVRYVIGDLLRAGDTDDEQRQMALGYFEAALGDPWVAKNLGFAVAESRAHTIMEMAAPPDDLIEQAIQDLQVASSAGGSDSAYQNRWRSLHYLAKLIMRYSQDRLAGLQEIEEAAALALQQFNAFGDEMQIVYQSEQMSEVFELLAFRYADFGWNDEALSALETIRGYAVRRYSMPADRVDTELQELQNRRLEDMVPAAIKDSGLPRITPAVSQRPIEEYFEDNPIGPAAKSLMRGHDDVPTALLCMWVTEVRPSVLGISALVCHMAGEDAWENKRHMWRADGEALALLRRQRWIQPGPFRERLLGTACRRGWEALLGPVSEMIQETGARRLVASLSGRLSRLPVEAFTEGSGEPAWPGLSVTYLPSVRFGADLVTRAGATAGASDRARVLALGYGGADMSEQEAELGDLTSIWGSQSQVIPGAQCTKKTVLEALAEPWDIVHIVCHGTFNEAMPLRSALHFCAERDDDARRVTAEDLLRQVQFPAHPLVILSACSSVVTADSHSNSFHGLAGSLFRAGAQAIIGSRWPVADGAARACMRELHRALRQGGPADLALVQATAALREQGRPLEDWAAFGYFGVA
jgi:CHAT domain-containing protein